MRILWSWPHPHREPLDVGAALVGSGADLTVQCLEGFRDETLPDGATFPYHLVRDLPDLNHARLSTPRRLVDRLRVHAVRAQRRDDLVATRRFDVVHLQQLTAATDVVAIRRLRRAVPLVAVVHDAVPHQSQIPPAIDRALHRQLYRLPHRLIALDESVVNELTSHFGVPDERIDLVPYDVPVRDHPKEVETSRPMALVFGSLRPNKGIDTVLAAARSLDASTLRIVVAGQGDPRIEAQVRTAASELPHLEAEIGFVSVQRREQLYREADLVVAAYTSAYTSMSAVLLDAYAHARPLVATDVGSIGRQVREDRSGWLVEPEDPGALARALRDAAADAATRHDAANRIVAARATRDAAARADHLLVSYEAARRTHGRRWRRSSSAIDTVCPGGH